MTTETTIATNNAGPSPALREAHQSAVFDLQLPIELELSNPWTIADQELREIAERPDCSPEARAYIAGVLDGRVQAGGAVAPQGQGDPLEQALLALAAAEKFLWAATKAADSAYRASLDAFRARRDAGDCERAEGQSFRRQKIHRMCDHLHAARDLADALRR